MSDFVKKEDAIRICKMCASAKYRVPYIEQAFENISTIDAVSEWIPCSERMPEEDGRYYVTRQDYVTQTDFTDILWYEKGLWWNRQSIGDYAVIAWTPLPKPWKGVDDETN